MTTPIIARIFAIYIVTSYAKLAPLKSQINPKIFLSYPQPKLWLRPWKLGAKLFNITS